MKYSLNFVGQIGCRLYIYKADFYKRIYWTSRLSKSKISATKIIAHYETVSNASRLSGELISQSFLHSNETGVQIQSVKATRQAG